nr:putative uncharacterized protein FLJ44672 [Aotus nancymaae]
MGTKCAHVGPSRASSCLPMAPWGPAPASHQPLREVQPMPPSGGLPRPGSSSLAASTGLRPASQQLLLAQLLASFQLPFLCRPEASSSGAFQATILPPAGLDRPCYCLTLATPGPALDSPQPTQHQLLPAGSFPLSRSCLAAWLNPSCVHRPSASSHWPVEAQLVPLADVSGPSYLLALASSLGPGPSLHQPFSAQLTSHGLSWASS